MLNYIEKLRSKSDVEKYKFALGVSAIITIIIFIFWLIALFSGINSSGLSFSDVSPEYDNVEIIENNKIEKIDRDTGNVRNYWDNFMENITNIINSSEIQYEREN